MLKQLACGAGLVGLGTALGQGIILLATPWLARIYAPEAFGVLALITSVSNIAMAAASLRYDLALPAAKDEHARPLLIAAVASALGIASLSLVAAFAFQALAEHAPTAPFDTPWLIAITILFAGLHQAGMGWATRHRAYGSIGLVRFTQGAGFSALALGTPIGLAWAHALSFVVALPLVLRGLLRKTTAETPSLTAALANRQFPLVSLPGALLDVIAYSLCIWFIAASYGAWDAGQYAQIQRLLGAPLMLVGTSLSQVLLRQSADIIHAPVQLERLFIRLLKALALLASGVILFTALFGQPVLRWFLGDQWRVDAMFITPIAIAVAVRACASPLSSILVTLGRFDLILRWQAAYFISAFIVLGVTSLQLDFDTFVMIYAIHECAFYGAYLFLIHSAIRSKTCAASSA